MRKLSLTLLAAGAILMGATQHASAQFFNYSTDFETPGGSHVINAFSVDTLSWLGINDIVVTPANSLPAGANVNLYTFATNSPVVPVGGAPGTFNLPYRIKVTIVPSDASGTPLVGYSAVTQFITGTITGELTPNINTLVNTYNNLVATPDGQAEVLNYVFAAAGMPTETFQLRALANGFSNGGSPVPQGGSAAARVVSTPEPGTLALFLGMGLSSAMVARRRMRRK